MIRRFQFALLCLVLLAGCSANLPAVSWCYRFDFRASNYGFAAILGSWVSGVGFIPDSNLRLKVTYVHSQTVTPQAVIITAARTGPTGLPLRVVGRADMFGMRVSTMETVVPENVSQGRFYAVTPGTGSSDKVEILGEATAPIALQTMDVRGNGSNPFAENNCSTAAIAESVMGAPGVNMPSGISEAIIDADNRMAGIDAPLTAPDGVPLLPAFNAQTVFGYAKWITSGAAGQEIAGPFAGVFYHLGLYVGMSVALSAIYGVVYAVVYLIRWVIWFIRFLAQLVQAIIAIVVSIPIILVAIKIIAILSIITAIAAGVALLVGGIDDFIKPIADTVNSIRGFLEGIFGGGGE